MGEYIIIGADFVPTDSNQDYFCNRCLSEIIDEKTIDLIKDASFRIFNLETPLTDKESPIEKCGPALIASTNTIAGYSELDVNLLVIGNNHIMDQGEQGFISTINTLENAGIDYVGGGKSRLEAYKPYYFDFASKRIGVYACAEHEFSIAGDKKCGANPYDPLESFDHVHDIKEKCDYVIVMYHGGKELYRYPSPELQKKCRKFIDKGADLVVCQHSHCIGCEEKYLNGTIVYGQGNFLFDRSESEFWKTSLLICVDENLHVSYFPLEKYGNGVKAAIEDNGKKILSEFNNRGENIKKEGFIDSEYSIFAKEMAPMYFMFFGARANIIFRAINKITNGKFNKFIMKRKYGSKTLRLFIYDFVVCEAHLELFRRGIQFDNEKWDG